MFAIARELGGMTAEELGERLSVEELVEWAVVFKLEHEAHEKARREASQRTKGR